MFLISHLFQFCDHAGFRADNNDVYLSSKELDEKVARLHISAHVEALKQIVRIRALVPLHLQPSTATHIVTHMRRAACSTHRNTHHTPRSRGVGTPGVIWHRKVPPSGLWLCGSASTWQWRAPDTSTFLATPPRNVLHVPTTTFRTGAACSRRPTHGPVVCRKRVNGYSYAVRQGARGVDTRLRWLCGVWLHCLCRPFLTRYFPLGHVAIYRCEAYKGNEWKIKSSLDPYFAHLDP